ncbi:hypothetical protein BDA96_07G006200 [Sorghum bicolor]|uniref:Uncharacterized protein n=2 Tax=Sorghum bicolor TaxID=4558 RepID=A0A1Z5R7P9_SORBI|nr:hypothetical protein BDA96_07G006200 [Sorghum bicolor]OQU79760.1 hypothetical protein SORBI_3007G005850 [Sorghum bicolor]
MAALPASLPFLKALSLKFFLRVDCCPRGPSGVVPSLFMPLAALLLGCISGRWVVEVAEVGTDAWPSVGCFATDDASPAGWSSRLLRWRRMLGRRLVRFATEDASGWSLRLQRWGQMHGRQLPLICCGSEHCWLPGCWVFFLFLA